MTCHDFDRPKVVHSKTRRSRCVKEEASNNRAWESLFTISFYGAPAMLVGSGLIGAMGKIGPLIFIGCGFISMSVLIFWGDNFNDKTWKPSLGVRIFLGLFYGATLLLSTLYFAIVVIGRCV